MADLVEWLTAQLAAGEAIARAAIQGPWYTSDADHLSPYVVYGASPVRDDRIVQVCNIEAAWQREANAAHIVANDPAHVLRTIAAHRAILARHQPGMQGMPGMDARNNCIRCSVLWPCADARDLAAIYQDQRPGFDPSWTVEDR